jgi:hypothetical protein
MLISSPKEEKAGEMSLPSLNDGTVDAAGTSNCYNPGLENANLEITGKSLQCPPHTTERKLIAKVDLRVVPLLCILYLFTFLDRCVISRNSQPKFQRDNATAFGFSHCIT